MTRPVFDRQPTLAGALVQLRPLEASDREALFAVASDRLLWEQHPNQTRFERVGFDAFFDESLASGGALVVTDRETGAVIGSSRYHGFDAAASEIEIGWTYLARSHWGGRYNGEVKRLMLAHAFQYVERVVFLIGPHNYRSQRAVEKLGAVRVGVRLNPAGAESLVYALRAPK